MKKSHSVKSRILLLLFAFIASVLAAFFINLVYIRRTGNQRILDTVAAVAVSKTDTLKAILSESALSAQRVVVYQPLRSLSDDPSEWYFYYQNLQASLNILESGYFPYSEFYYFAYNRKQDYFLRGSTHSMPIYEEKALVEWLGDPDSLKSYSWQARTFHGTDYYIYCIAQGDFISGVYVSAPAVLRFFSRSSPKDTLYAVKGEAQDFSAEDSRLQNIELKSDMKTLRLDGELYAVQWYPTTYDFEVASVTRLSGGIGSLLVENPYILLLLLALFIFVPVFYIFMNKELLKPLNYLRFGFSRVAAGDLSFRGQTAMFSSEFNEVIKAFNSMLRQIRELRMNYYEEKILQQQTENRYLRTISYPHFLLNNLNLINNFAYEKNEEGIHTAVMNLSQYLRYFITADSSVHTLKNDVESARCYLNLNCLAYPDRIRYSFDVDESLLELSFPPLVISTIVENCIKHGLAGTDILKISLRLAREGNAFVFEAENNGPAFPDPVLHMVNSAEVPDKNTTHIGLLSVKQTLYSLYKDACSFKIQNHPDGVLVSIRIDMEALKKQQSDR